VKLWNFGETVGQADDEGYPEETSQSSSHTAKKRRTASEIKDQGSEANCCGCIGQGGCREEYGSWSVSNLFSSSTSLRELKRFEITLAFEVGGRYRLQRTFHRNTTASDEHF
jgi:hypothetical protein